ncbi:flagellar biosynthetic protein FlhB [Peptoclostridium acidaminophilum DSM 3953]|uniref:Flagellar biosynthetic protein FlhB n=1 Tax=Peptoclostridium acidaminophilum DSM 3953 TaxID=1286171 RepID=W8T4I6_PEPAC|nr:flagellar biosynthetic protein FlhB [Peptoclostridium acidaminophilum DSM 3953]
MYLNIDLQLFSGEKTEKATPKKRQDARQKGQVFQSREVNSAVTLIISMLILKLGGKAILTSIAEPIPFYGQLFNEEIDTDMAFKILYTSMIFLVKASAVIVLANYVSAFASSYSQVGNVFTAETLKFKIDRLNPLEGIKRLFSARSAFEVVKSLAKLAVLSIVSTIYIKSNMGLYIKTYQLNKYQFSYILYDSAINLGLVLAGILIALAVFDYFFQRYQHEKQLKMSKQEIKEEYKQMEGNPEIKSKIKEKQRQFAMRRMMEDVSKADVIITNPTHYAVALKYDENANEAPFIIAKGKNLIALKIRERAAASEVPMVENKPLARELYSKLNIGDIIPPELYDAVAQILAYVYSKDRYKHKKI